MTLEIKCKHVTVSLQVNEEGKTNGEVNNTIEDTIDKVVEACNKTTIPKT